jgi:transcriptional regulator with PAS, ATPase and Fis domain
LPDVKKYGMLFSSLLGDTPTVDATLQKTMTMKTRHANAIARMLDIGYEEFLPFFDGFSEGLLIVDRTGTIIYYNPTMTAIDDLGPADVLGKKVLDVYDLTEEGSVIMQCLKTRQPIIDRSLLYRTRWGKIANTLHTVFPAVQAGPAGRRHLSGARIQLDGRDHFRRLPSPAQAGVAQRHAV